MRPHVVEPRAGEGASPADVRAADTPAGVAPAAPPPGRPSRSASRTSRRAAHLPRLVSAPGAERALVVSDGTALPPLGAPAAVRAIIAAGNVIARTPYKWGGGHGRWQDTGYDCSGSVSYALAAAGLLDGPLTSGALMSWGGPGPGRWVTVYANAGHTFLEVAGVRFDTSGAQRTGSRWQPAQRSTAGFAVRHPAGL
jgi:cell wall-associated NlpC family hydrolase